jgi:hypothetical protein
MTDFDFSKVSTSIKVERPDKRPLRFSSRRDYLQALLEQGVISSKHELIDKPELVAKIQQHWQRRRGQIGCAFAQFMSDDPPSHDWHRLVITGSLPQTWQAPEMGQYLNDAIQDQDNSALSLIVPEVRNDRQLAELIWHVSALPNCLILEFDDSAQSEEIIYIGLRVPLNENVLAFALVFGPFSYFPLTRQAPFTEIIFPTKPKTPPLRKGLTKDPGSAHLADVHLRLGDDAWQKMMKNTKRLKAEVLSRDHPGARARVTVGVQRRIWEEVKQENE